MMNHPGMLFNQLLRAHHNACMTALIRQGVADVGSPQLLVELSRYPDDSGRAPTQKELAQRLHSAPATIAVSLKSLERAGYVTRRVDPVDSRRNRISITPKGRDVVESGMRAFQQVDDHMFHGFSPEEREQVRQFHQRMLDNLDQIGGRQQDTDRCPHCPPGAAPISGKDV